LLFALLALGVLARLLLRSRFLRGDLPLFFLLALLRLTIGVRLLDRLFRFALLLLELLGRRGRRALILGWGLRRRWLHDFRRRRLQILRLDDAALDGERRCRRRRLPLV